MLKIKKSRSYRSVFLLRQQRAGRSENSIFSRYPEWQPASAGQALKTYLLVSFILIHKELVLKLSYE